MILSIIYRLLRINQWVKNLFIFIPAFFAGVFFSDEIIFELFLGFISFGMAASSIYILNDSIDVKEDRLHPQKKFRPIARGLISIRSALTVSAMLVIMAFMSAYVLSKWFFIIVLIYFILQVGYSLGLKKLSNIDVLIISMGFVLRTLAGGVIINVAISQWLIIMIFLLSLFLALAKRLDDVNLLSQSNITTRITVKRYNLQFITSAITMVASVIIVSYIMYTISHEVQERMGSEYLYITSIFVIAGLMRYLQIALVENDSGAPSKLLYSDKFIIINIICWITSFFIIIYI